ncbi:hypothetical protein Rhal01_03366 [Rubritalea halochordaticola]|uniref:Type II secretion system protein GspF domain-containing protein n=1 Tax=Rubritalea halochordaticola TaxID=714537 RepID=A0ABP9V3E3_9BACT
MNNIQSNTANHNQSTSPPSSEKPKSGMQREIQLFGASKPKRFSTKEAIQFYRGIASMIRAQINTADALKYYAEGLPNKVMAAALMDIRNDINSGISVYEAFKKSKRFDDMTLGLIKAGMDSGRLDSAFNDLSERAKADLHMKKKIRKIIMVPALIFPVLICAFIYTQVKIIPEIKDMVVTGDYEPKGPVRIFFKISDTVIAFWPIAIVVLVSIIATLALSNKIRQGILNLAMSKWRTLRKLIMGLRQVTFLGVIKLLHANGINLAKAITTSATSVKGTPLHDELLMAAEKYEKAGVPLSIAFTKYTSVDDQVVHMLSIGEKSASMGAQLSMLTEMYESDCEQLMEDFTNVLNFIVMLVATSMIALVFLGVFMPIFLMGPEMMEQR